MSSINCDTNKNNSDKDDVSCDIPIRIIECPLCVGSGTILCNIKNSKIKCSFSIPQQPEQKCSCCDGKGWVTQTLMTES
ncbi:MAG TPA: hypothetical protein VFD60_10995, partial [Nitrososphaeraceae archaeon]|nr:hypothetical protein [Nitrososphaeraceae archaeon]